MKRFHFPLESVIRLRERRLETERARMAATRAELQCAVRERVELDALRRDEEAMIGAACDLAALDRYREAARRKGRQLQERIAAIEGRAASQQAVLQAAERDYEVLVRMRSKAGRQWQMAADREQQAVADEAFLSRWEAVTAAQRQPEPEYASPAGSGRELRWERRT